MVVVLSDTDRNNVSILCQPVTDSINECVSVLISDVYNPIRKMVIYIYEKLQEMVRKLILSLKPTLIDFEITLSKIQHQTYTNINAIRGPPQILKKIYKFIVRQFKISVKHIVQVFLFLYKYTCIICKLNV